MATSKKKRQPPVLVHLQLQGAELPECVRLTPDRRVQLPCEWVELLLYKSVKLKHADGYYVEGFFGVEGCSVVPFERIRADLEQQDTFGTRLDPICLTGQVLRNTS